MNPAKPALLTDRVRYLDVLADPNGEHVVPEAASRPWTGERLLHLAILEDAIRVLFKYHGLASPKGAKLWWEAWDWLVSPAADDPFDYICICTSVGLDPDWVREGLRKRMVPGVRPVVRRHRARGGGNTRVTTGVKAVS